ncbi:MAG: glycosyltransferase family 1 protein [Proteobacteria bacterium]|nr:MAG: glycosyltransferase family 1 protein [Pseudomonadota bacterium]
MNTRMKKRIAVVAPDLEDLGGVQSIVEMVVRLIEASDRYECKIISLATAASDKLSTRLRSPSSWMRGVRTEVRYWRGRTVIHVGCNWSEFEFMRYRPRPALSALLADCDLVQVIGGFPAWGAVVPASALPVANWAATRCLWERSTLLGVGVSPKVLWRQVMTKIVDRLDARAMAQADKRMVMNPLMREYAVMLAPQRSEDVVYAPPGVDIHWFAPGANNAPLPSVPYVLVVGRLGDSRKNPALLLEAFLRFRKLVASPVRLVLAGATGPDDSFWSQAEQAGVKGEITFHASPDKHALLALYQGATCLALSSNEEGFGMVLVESMACGTPVVATRCGGPEGIVSDGQDGFLVGVGDSDALAKKLAQLFLDSDLRRKMAQCARQTAVQRFSEEVSGNAFFGVWDELTEQNHGE